MAEQQNVTIKILEYDSTSTAEAGTNTTNITITGHGMSDGDFIVNETRRSTSQSGSERGSRRITVVDDDNVEIDVAISGQTDGDSIRIYKFNSINAYVMDPTLQLTKKAEGDNSCSFQMKTIKAPGENADLSDIEDQIPVVIYDTHEDRYQNISHGGYKTNRARIRYKSICKDGNGNLYVGFFRKDSATTYDWAVYFSDDDGATWSDLLLPMGANFSSQAKSGYLSAPTLYYDATNNKVHVAYLQSIGAGTNDLVPCYNAYDISGTAWDYAVNSQELTMGTLVEYYDLSYCVGLIVDSTGDVYVFCECGTSFGFNNYVRYNITTDGGSSWVGWNRLPGATTGYYARWCTMILDNDGNTIHLAFQSLYNLDLYYTYWDGATWSAAATIVAKAENIYDMKMTKDGNGDVWLAFSEYAPAPDTTLFYKLSDGSWSLVTTITEGVTIPDAATICFDFDYSADRLIMIYTVENEQNMKAVEYDITGDSWGTVYTLPILSGYETFYFPNLLIDGNLYVVYNQGNDIGGSVYEKQVTFLKLADFEDAEATLYQIYEGQYLKVLFDSTRYFLGIIDTADKALAAEKPSTEILTLFTQIQAKGLNSISARRTIKIAYSEGDLTSDIADDMIDFLTQEGIDAGTINTGVALEEDWVDDCISISEVLDACAEKNGFQWFIDRDWKLQFYQDAGSIGNAAHQLVDGNGFKDYVNVKISGTINGYVNKVFVAGGNDGNGDQVFVNRGQIERQNAMQEICAGSGVYGAIERDTQNSIYDEYTAEAGTTTTNITITGHNLIVNDFVWNKTRKTSTYVTEVINANNVTVETIAGQTNGDTIIIYRSANIIAANILKRQSMLPKTITFESDEVDWEPQTKLNVELANLGIPNTYYNIEEVQIKQVGRGYYKSTITAVLRDNSDFSTQKRHGDAKNFFKNL